MFIYGNKLKLSCDKLRLISPPVACFGVARGPHTVNPALPLSLDKDIQFLKMLAGVR